MFHAHLEGAALPPSCGPRGGLCWSRPRGNTTWGGLKIRSTEREATVRATGELVDGNVKKHKFEADAIRRR